MHPFIVTDDLETLKTTTGFTDKPVMAHNGVFNYYAEHTSPFNDTFHFVKEFASVPELLELLKLDSKKFEKVFKQTLSYNKLAFIFPDRDLIMTGAFKEDDGYFHSNDGYKSYTYDFGGSSGNTRAIANRHGGYPNNQLETKFWPDTDDDTEMSDDEYLAKRDQTVGNNHNLYRKGRSIDQALEDRRKDHYKLKSIDLPKFEHKDINITKDNFNHFIFTVKDKDYNTFVKKNKGYTIEEWNKNGEPITYITEMGAIKEVNGVWIENFLKHCRIYSKNEHKSMYHGLSKIINKNGYRPSKSCIKKMGRLLDLKMSNEIKFKEYGIIYRADLKWYYDQVKDNVEPSVSKKTVNWEEAEKKFNERTDEDSHLNSAIPNEDAYAYGWQENYD